MKCEECVRFIECYCLDCGHIDEERFKQYIERVNNCAVLLGKKRPFVGGVQYEE